MYSTDEKSGFYAALLFVVWPLLALISAFRNYKSSWGKNILWAFVAFYGFSFAIGIENSNSDIVRYVAKVHNLYGTSMTLSDFYHYFLNSGELDILQSLIAFFVSRFTDMQAILTLVYGIIFGFFFSRNVWYVLEHLKGRIKPINVLLISCFFLVIPIWNLNGFRFWTASHIFIYGILPFLFEGKKKGLFISMSSILVHFAFIVPVIVLMGYLLLGNRLIIYFAFFLTTFFISQINVTVFNQVIGNYTPEVLQERTSSYRSENKVKEFRTAPEKNRNWYVVWYGKVLDWSVMGFLVILFLKGRTFFTKNKKWLSLFSFTLLFYGVANLFSSLPSGGRYGSIAQILALALIMLYIQNREQKSVMERFIWAATPALLLFIVVAARSGLYSISATTLLGNPFTAIFLMGKNISLNDVMRMFL